MSPTQVAYLESYMDARSTQTIDDATIAEIIEDYFQDNPGIGSTSLEALSFLLYEAQEEYGHSCFNAHDFKRVLQEQFGF